MAGRKLWIVTLALLACSGCSVRDGLVLSETPIPTENSIGRGLVEGVEDMLDQVESTARDLGRRAEEKLQ